MLSSFLKKRIPSLCTISDFISKSFTSGYGYSNPQNSDKIYSPSINERLVWINIVNYGKFERIAAYEGESLLTALTNFKVEGVPALCEGGEEINSILEKPIDPLTYGPFCSHCHVIIADPWRQQMGEIHYLEEKNLEESSSPISPNSRLACCVLVEKWMNEMIVTIGGNADPNDENYV